MGTTPCETLEEEQYTTKCLGTTPCETLEEEQYTTKCMADNTMRNIGGGTVFLIANKKNKKMECWVHFMKSRDDSLCGMEDVIQSYHK
jgi:hypothetical protein